MKTLLLILIASTSLMAQSIKLSIGVSLESTSKQTSASSIAYATFPASSSLLPGQNINIGLSFWADSLAQSQGFKSFTPVVLNGSNVAQKISNVIIQLSLQQIMGPNLPVTIYQVVSDSLNSQYGWNTNVIY